MALLSAKFESKLGRAFSFSNIVLLLVSLAAPRALLPDGLPLACSATAWVFFACSLLDISRGKQLLFQLASAVALVTLAALAPPVWLVVSLSLGVVGWIGSQSAVLQKSGISVGIGFACPALFYAAICAAGPDQRTALKLAFRVNSSPFELFTTGLGLTLLMALTVTLLTDIRLGAQGPAGRLGVGLALAIFGVLTLRLVFIASVATLRTDLMVWSESPALVNLLKLHNGEPFYGPMQWANSYSYSPGLELTQYALLRPVHWELSLRAHRALGLFWQLASAVVLSRALWPWLSAGLRAALSSLGYPALLAALASVTLSSLLAPHVHPDHLLLLCFSAAILFCLRPDPFRRGDWVALAVLPIAATAFKLTGAGIGLGLVLAALFERRWPVLGVLFVSGILALLTVPLFDATLGSFSAYAIRLQASHPMEWWRIRAVSHTAPGLIFEVAVLALAASGWMRPGLANARAATRVLFLTFGFGSTSLVAFLKHGGRENSLMPFALGGIAALLVLLGDRSEVSERERPAAWYAALPVILFWAALSSRWPDAPVTGETRRSLIQAHDRELSFLRQLFAQGQRPLPQGTAAWIDAGRRDTPRDRLSSASELDLGRVPALRECENRLLSGHYDGLFLSARALTDNPFLRRLRPRLERAYDVAESQFASGRDGYVILTRRE